MVVTFTGSIAAIEGDRVETRTVLVAAIGCNLAWGIVDAAMYLMANFAERARGLTTLRAIHHTLEPDAAVRLIGDGLPSVVSNALTPTEVEAIRSRLNARSESSTAASLNRRDFRGAAAVFLLVFLSTFPVAMPFLLIHELGWALRVSNLIALLMLFVTGWSLGRYAGRPGWRTGIGMVAV